MKQELEFASFDDFAEMLQEEENTKNLSNQTKTDKKKECSTSQTSKGYHRKKDSIFISLEEYKKRTKKPKELTSIKKKISSKLAQKKPSKKKKIASISKQIKKNVAKQTRFTEPKKRNLLSRIILQEKMDRGSFEYVEDYYDTFLPSEIEDSKNAKKRSEKRLYKEVQAYEDARDDVTVRRGWRAFKIGLATSLLATSLALANHVGNEVKETFSQRTPTSIVSLAQVDEEKKDYYETQAQEFANQVRENSGYEFDYLSDSEFLDGYLRILNKEKKMSESQFRGALYSFKDQERLDSIVSNCFGEEEYAEFSDEQKRDYRQLAFELLPVALPDVFETNHYIRNPIVCDELEIKDDLKTRGYKIELVVNADQKDAVKAIGKLMHISNVLKATETPLSTTNDGQDILEDMVKQALGEQYDELSKKELRDYKQIAYELLDDESKTYIKDPIEVEKTTEDMEIGD